MSCNDRFKTNEHQVKRLTPLCTSLQDSMRLWELWNAETAFIFGGESVGLIITFPVMLVFREGIPPRCFYFMLFYCYCSSSSFALYIYDGEMCLN